MILHRLREGTCSLEFNCLCKRDGGRRGGTPLSVCVDKLKISDSVTSLQLQQQSSLNSSVEPVKMCSESFKGPFSAYLDCSRLVPVIIKNFTTSHTIMVVFSQEPVAGQHPTTYFPWKTAAGPLHLLFFNCVKSMNKSSIAYWQLRWISVTSAWQFRCVRLCFLSL